MQTPYYEIHKRELEKNIEDFSKALAVHWGNARIGYSFKTNSLPWILKFMRDHGCYAEVVSEDEYLLGKKLGYEHFVYNGPIKTKATFYEALEEGQIVNLDSQRELRWLQEWESDKTAKVGLRVNFDLEKECPGETVAGEAGARFGFCYENGELEKAIRQIEAMPHAKLDGLHMHSSSRTRSLRVYRSLAAKACEIRERYGLALAFVDIGGGFFGGLPEKPSYDAYIEAIAGELKKAFCPEETRLIIEPGASVICSPVDLVTSVIDVKHTSKNCFAVTDGSRIYIDPHMKMSSYFYEIERENPEVETVEREQLICGFTCMESDRLITLRDEKQLQVGDRVIYHKAGSYTMCFTPLFIQYFPAVYVEEDGVHTCVREKWTVEEYVQKSNWE